MTAAGQPEGFPHRHSCVGRTQASVPVSASFVSIALGNPSSATRRHRFAAREAVDRSIQLPPKGGMQPQHHGQSMSHAKTQTTSSKPTARSAAGDAQSLTHPEREFPSALPGHLHTARHSFISRSLLAGIPEAVVREGVGHADDEIIRRYTHVAAEQSQSLMRLADGRPVPGSGKEKCVDEGKVEETQSGV